MKTIRLVVSDMAAVDVVEQADWYEAHAGISLAERWGKAVTSAVLRITKNPGAGAPCNFNSPELRDIRRMTITGFPKHLIFYRFADGEIFVMRVLHGARDIEHLL